MCGRTACTLQPSDVRAVTGCTQWRDEQKYKGPSFNVAPTDYQPCIIHDGQGRVLQYMRWGLVPSYWKEPNMRDLSTVNARCESLESPMWRELLKNKRCVVIAEGFYEWKEQNNKRQPYYLRMEHKEDKKEVNTRPLLFFAGLWDCWVDPEKGTTLYTYTIVTTPAPKKIQWYDIEISDNDCLSRLHHRMPVILDTQEKIDMWLDPSRQSIASLKALLVPFEGDLECYPVSNLVNSWKNDNKNCIKRLDEYNNTVGIKSFFKPVVKSDNNKTSKPSTVKKEVKEEELPADMPPLEEIDTDNKDNKQQQQKQDQKEEERQQGQEQQEQKPQQEEKDKEKEEGQENTEEPPQKKRRRQ